jgi:hypothetical protein
MSAPSWKFFRLYPGSRPEILDYFVANHLGLAGRGDAPVPVVSFARRREGHHEESQLYLEIALLNAPAAAPAPSDSAVLRAMRSKFLELCGTHVNHYKPLFSLEPAARERGIRPLELVPADADEIQGLFVDVATAHLVRLWSARVCDLVREVLAAELAGETSRKTLVPVLADLTERAFLRTLGLTGAADYVVAHAEFCAGSVPTLRALDEAIVQKHTELLERSISVPFAEPMLSDTEIGIRRRASRVIDEIADELLSYPFEDPWLLSAACHRLSHVLHNGAGLSLAEEFYLTSLKSLALVEKQIARASGERI